MATYYRSTKNNLCPVKNKVGQNFKADPSNEKCIVCKELYRIHYVRMKKTDMNMTRLELTDDVETYRR